jgi:hypothetical protein
LLRFEAQSAGGGPVKARIVAEHLSTVFVAAAYFFHDEKSIC